MNNLLVFFALPVATIILAIVLQKILRSPILVSATAFAIYLIVTYAVFDTSFLIFTFVYTILAFLSAYITNLLSRYTINNCSNFNRDNTNNLTEIDNISNQNSNENYFNSNSVLGAKNENYFNQGSVLGTNNDYNFYENYSMNNQNSPCMFYRNKKK